MSTSGRPSLTARPISLATVNVCEVGTEHDQTLVFLHGNSRTWKDWIPQLTALAAQFRCVAYDHRGFGESSRAGRLLSLATLADDAVALCETLGIGHAYFVGISLGSQVAQLVAIRHPEKVDGVVLGGSPYFGPELDLTSYVPEPPSNAVLAMSDEELREATIRTLPASDRPSPAQMEYAQEIFREELRRGTLTIMAEEFGWLTQYERVVAPALVVNGSEEHVPMCTPEDAKQMAARIPRGEHAIIPGAGHISNLDAPEAFNQLLIDFVARYPPPAR